MTAYDPSGDIERRTNRARMVFSEEGVLTMLRDALGSRYDEDSCGISDMLPQIQGWLHDLDTAVELLEAFMPGPGYLAIATNNTGKAGRFEEFISRYFSGEENHSANTPHSPASGVRWTGGRMSRLPTLNL